MNKRLVLCSAIFATTAFGNTWDNVETKADFRYRLENTKDELKGEAQSRQRIRARVGLNYKVDDVTKIKLRLSTAGGATSTNDTLGDSSGDAGAVYFDRAYLSHKAGDIALNMGRMAQPFFKAGKNQLIWDGDFNPEGIHAGYKWNGAYVNLGSFWVDENKASSTDDGLDVTITSSQIGYAGSAGSVAYNVGASNYHYEYANEKNTFSTDEGMNILETYLEIKYKAAIPVTFFFSATTNNEAEDDNAAHIVGVSVGKTKNKGSWKAGVNSRTVELNAIASTFMDSDFAGRTTDSSGTIVWGKYMVTDKSYVSLGLFNNTKNADEKASPASDSEAYTKMQLDYGVKF